MALMNKSHSLLKITECRHNRTAIKCHWCPCMSRQNKRFFRKHKETMNTRIELRGMHFSFFRIPALQVGSTNSCKCKRISCEKDVSVEQVANTLCCMTRSVQYTQCMSRYRQSIVG